MGYLFDLGRHFQPLKVKTRLKGPSGQFKMAWQGGGMVGFFKILFWIRYLKFKVLSQIYSYEHFLEKNAPISRFENLKNPPTG